MKEVVVYPFQPRDIKRGSVILIIGRRWHGKTSLATALALQLGHYGVRMSHVPTNGGPHWPATFPRLKYNYDNEKYAISLCNKNAKPSVIVYDDIIPDTRFWESEVLKDLLMNGRWRGITTIITMQWMDPSILPFARANVDYVFCFKEEYPMNRRRTWEYFGGVWEYQKFDEVFKLTTLPYETFVISQNDLHRRFFWYKNPLFPKFVNGKLQHQPFIAKL